MTAEHRALILARHYAGCDGCEDMDHFDEALIEVLRHTTDVLWGFMPSAQVHEIREDVPELAEFCVKVHHDLWHATTHEERMMR